MADLKFIGVIVFTLILFAWFTSVYNNSEEAYYQETELNGTIPNGTVEISGFEALSEGLKQDTGSDIGNLIFGGMGIMAVFLVLRYARGQG